MKKDILLVEDNFFNQRLAIAIFKKSNYSFDLAQNGKEAVDLVTTGNYGIILMDIQMPVMDGLQATREIRKFEQNKKLFPTPIFAVTAYAEDDDIDKFQEAGINDFLRKPFSLQQLLDFIKKYYIH